MKYVTMSPRIASILWMMICGSMLLSVACDSNFKNMFSHWFSREQNVSVKTRSTPVYDAEDSVRRMPYCLRTNNFDGFFFPPLVRPISLERSS